MQWPFDFLSTELIKLIISFVIGAIGGTAVGYRMGFNKVTVKQSQKAENNTNQTQIGSIINHDGQTKPKSRR